MQMNCQPVTLSTLKLHRFTDWDCTRLQYNSLQDLHSLHWLSQFLVKLNTDLEVVPLLDREEEVVEVLNNLVNDILK